MTLKLIRLFILMIKQHVMQINFLDQSVSRSSTQAANIGKIAYVRIE